MEFRIGINLGDVVVKGEDIYGDGVNIAARLESLAEPGGICISGTVYDSIRHKLSLEYEYLGEQSVKNIKEPVRVFRVLTQTEAEARAPVRARRALASSWRKLGLTIAGLLFLVGGAIAAWNLYFSPSVSQRDTASEKRLPLPEKPSIAVLPLPT
ncbi:MAG: adenylate/guanylate cyclase domain-containing protein, partial [Candidatus Binatia bacterium]